MKFSAQNKTLPFQGKKCALDFRGGQPEKVCQRTRGDWSDRFHSSPHQFTNGVGPLPLSTLVGPQSERKWQWERSDAVRELVRGSERRLDTAARVDHLQHRKPLSRDPERIRRQEFSSALFSSEQIKPRFPIACQFSHFLIGQSAGQ